MRLQNEFGSNVTLKLWQKKSQTVLGLIKDSSLTVSGHEKCISVNAGS
jgi:hypothetical protein